MWRRRGSLAVLCALALGACGGGSSATPPTTTTTAATAGHFTYGPRPSVSALMICHEAVGEIAPVLGVRTVHAPIGTWRAHTYTCPYRYANGTMVLWVRELPTLAATSAYMASLKHRLGDTEALTDVGQGGFETRGGWTVTRKDNKVLVVDVAGLPATFGHPATARWEVAQTVADLIFACWRGD